MTGARTWKTLSAERGFRMCWTSAEKEVSSESIFVPRGLFDDLLMEWDD